MEKSVSIRSSLHIGIDGTALYGVYGGVEYSLWNLLVALRALDTAHRFTVWIPHDGPTENQTATFGANWTWRRLRFRGSAKIRRIYWQQCELPRLLRRQRCDLLHAPTYVAPLRVSIPVVLGVYDLIALTHPEFATPANRRHYGLVLPRCLASAARIVVPSTAVKDDIERLVPRADERVEVVPLGVEAAFFAGEATDAQRAVRERYGLPPEYLLFSGNFEPKKNLVTLLRALDQVPDAPPLALVGGGRAWSGHDLESLLLGAPRAVRSRVCLIGYVPRRDMPAIFAGCRAFVFPSLAEGFCLPVAEALASGAPVVTSDAVPLPNLKHVALLSSPTDETALADNIRRVLSDAALATRLRAAGRDYARQFTWQRSARQMLQIYESIGAQALKRP